MGSQPCRPKGVGERSDTSKAAAHLAPRYLIFGSGPADLAIYHQCAFCFV
jgi:hypothetical protein